MNKEMTTLSGSMIALILLASCAGSRSTTQVRDDVYFMPSEAPAVAATKRVAPEPKAAPPTDDYYDSATAEQFATPRNYYDMAYNDPYYYNYGRFGWGTGMGMGGMGMGMGGMGMGMGGMGMGMGGMGMGMGGMGMGMGGMGMGMGWQNGWAGPGWGMSMGYGWGSGMGMSPWGGGMGWNNPWMGMGYGWGSPWGPAGYNPWGWGGPMGWYDPFYGGYGYGPYWGPMGNCFSCYAPIIIGGSSNTVVGHRPSISGGGGSGGQSGDGGAQPRMTPRDPVSLNPQVRAASYSPSSSRPARTTAQPGGSYYDRNSRIPTSPWVTPPQQQQQWVPQQRPAMEPRTRQMREHRGTPERYNAPDRSGGFDRGGGGGSRSPSSPGGGGSRSGGGGRPR